MKNKIQPPLIVFIVGTTASGKTKLSIELAKRFNGEIIRSSCNLAPIPCSSTKRQTF